MSIGSVVRVSRGKAEVHADADELAQSLYTPWPHLHPLSSHLGPTATSASIEHLSMTFGPHCCRPLQSVPFLFPACNWCTAPLSTSPHRPIVQWLARRSPMGTVHAMRRRSAYRRRPSPSARTRITLSSPSLAHSEALRWSPVVLGSGRSRSVQGGRGRLPRRIRGSSAPLSFSLVPFDFPLCSASDRPSHLVCRLLERANRQCCPSTVAEKQPSWTSTRSGRGRPWQASRPSQPRRTVRIDSFIQSARRCLALAPPVFGRHLQETRGPSITRSMVTYPFGVIYSWPSRFDPRAAYQFRFKWETDQWVPPRPTVRIFEL